MDVPDQMMFGNGSPGMVSFLIIFPTCFDDKYFLSTFPAICVLWYKIYIKQIVYRLFKGQQSQTQNNENNYMAAAARLLQNPALAAAMQNPTQQPNGLTTALR